MNLDELKDSWQADAPGPEPGHRNEEETMQAIRLQAKRFDRKLRIRDWLETTAALVVVAIFAAVLPSMNWLARAGLGLVIAACFFIAWRLHATRRCRQAVGADRPVAEVLAAEVRRIDDQIGLLESVLWWYILPIALGCVMAVAGMRGLGWFTLGYAGLVIALGAFIYWLNQRAVRAGLKPRRRELVRMLEADRGTRTGGESE